MSLQINVKMKRRKKTTVKQQLISLLNTTLIITQLFSIYFINQKKKFIFCNIIKFK